MSSEQIPENNTPPVETPKAETPTETTQTPETKTEGLVSSTTSSTVQTAKSWKETISEEYTLFLVTIFFLAIDLISISSG